VWQCVPDLAPMLRRHSCRQRIAGGGDQRRGEKYGSCRVGQSGARALASFWAVRNCASTAILVIHILAGQSGSAPPDRQAWMHATPVRRAVPGQPVRSARPAHRRSQSARACCTFRRLGADHWADRERSRVAVDSRSDQAFGRWWVRVDHGCCRQAAGGAPDAGSTAWGAGLPRSPVPGAPRRDRRSTRRRMVGRLCRPCHAARDVPSQPPSSGRTTPAISAGPATIRPGAHRPYAWPATCTSVGAEPRPLMRRGGAAWHRLSDTSSVA
jgi:hypothetical protein